MLKIVLNDDEKEVKKIKQALQENDGYCPCRLLKTKDTKCVCKKFREQSTPGYCHCGLFKKIEVTEENT